jgi:probable rRNA maturation factor
MPFVDHVSPVSDAGSNADGQIRATNQSTDAANAEPGSTGPQDDEPLSSDDEPDGACSIDVSCELDIDARMLDWLEGQLRRLTVLAGEDDATLSVGIVDDEQMADYHEQYSGVSGTTDVLTFDLRNDPGNPDEPIDGDIVICLDEAMRQASARGHDVRLELLLYALHGLLHLQGYNDHDPDEHKAMHDREDELLTEAGLGEVFKRVAPDED